MPDELANLFSCTYRSVVLALETATVSSDPQAKQGVGRTGTIFSAQCSGNITGTDAVDLSSNLLGAFNAFNASGADFVLKGLDSTVLFILAAATCTDGGPHVKIVFKPASTPLRMTFTITVNANALPPSDGSSPVDTYKLSVQTRPDRGRQITRSGELNGADTPAYFLGSVMPSMRSAYPLPGWTIESQYENSSVGIVNTLTYSVTATEMAGSLPSSSSAIAVTGEYTYSKDRDEQHRLTEQHQYDLVLDRETGSAWQDLVDSLRPTDVLVYRESVRVTTIREVRLQAAFAVLAGADELPIMNYDQSVELQQQQTIYEVKSYPGADPVYVRKPKGAQILVQQGSAICSRNFMKPPDPICNGLLSLPQISFTSIDDVQKRTTWRYEMYTTALGFQPDDTDWVTKFQPEMIERQSLEPGFFPVGSPPL